MNYNSFVFVFSKSVDKTDIQKGELLSLIEMQKNDIVIRIKSIEEIESQGGISFNNNDLLKNVEDGFVCVTFLSQCALVLSSIELDIKEIIRRSGYIQSGGKLLFISKWENLEIDFIQHIVLEFCKKEEKYYNIVFYKEKDNQTKIKLEGLLIDDKRYHIGDKSFNVASDKIVSDLKDQFGDLKLQNGGDSIFLFREKAKIRDNSILADLYEDRDLVDYCVCYLSEYKKDNIFHEMDDLKERKPFWSGIFTTPHRLMNAMLNIAKVDQNSIVLDPFCHTGTLAIEASQIGCKVIVSDIFGTIGAKDNYDFLCSGANNFLNLVKKISDNIKNKDLTGKLLDIIDKSTYLNNQGLPEANNEVLTEIKELDERLYFYILRRYMMENLRGAELDPLNKFLETYLSSDKNDPGYGLFAKQLELFENTFRVTNESIITLNKENEEFFTDSFYKTKRIGYLNNSVDNYPSFQKNDICSKDDYNIDKDSIDAIVTDPPYGYGEDLNANQVEEIYTYLIEKSIKWLKPGGSLIFCALDKVKTGRIEGLIFTERILEIVNFTAKKNNAKFIMNDILLTNKHLKNVYYWKSKYALNRSIISLQIIKN
jgi:hypothetical protein